MYKILERGMKTNNSLIDARKSHLFKHKHTPQQAYENQIMNISHTQTHYTKELRHRSQTPIQWQTELLQAAQNL